MQYLTFNDKTITCIFSYVNDEYFSIKLRHLKIKHITVETVSGEDLQWGGGFQWFLVPLQIFRGGGVCNEGRSAIYM